MSLDQLSSERLRALERTRTMVVLGGVLAAAPIAGLLIGALGVHGVAAVVGAVVLMLLPFAFWRAPATVALIPFGAALLIEQFPLNLADKLTEQIPLFWTLSTSGMLGGLFVTPAEIVVGLGLLTWSLRAVAERRPRPPRTPLGVALTLMILLLVASLVRGVAAGGVFKIAVDEVRPFLMVAILYLIASRTLCRRERLWALPWVMVLITGFKGLQGTYRYFVLRNTYPVPESILGHEEAVFFSLYILLAAGLWMFGIRGRLRVLATILLPFVVVADLANQRRTAWVIIGFGALLLLVAAWLRCRERRRLTLIIAMVGGISMAGYLPLFWHSSGTIGQPARALRSAFDPNSRDDDSDRYRVIETLDLGLDIRETPLGLGLGRPIDHPVPLPIDVSKDDPLIDYVPHNGILYFWLKNGFAGALLFWFVIGSAMALGCRVLMQAADRRTALIGLLAMWAVEAYVFEGWFDHGLVVTRVAIAIGCLLGAAEAARRLSAATAEPALAGQG